MSRQGIKYIIFLLALSYVFFIWGNGIVNLTNPDEVFYAQTAKEMAKYKTWMTPYLFDSPQFEKPILLYWLLRVSTMIFPDTNFAVRFFPALFAALGVIAVYLLGLLGFKNEKKAFISALVLMSGGLYIGLARSVFTDMIFSVFILFSLLSFYWGYLCRQRKGIGISLFFVFSALAVLTKGPLGILIPFLVILVFLLVNKDIKFLFCRSVIWGGLIFIAISFPWYILMFKKYGVSFTREFFYNDHIRRFFYSEHPENDTWYFYLVNMVTCVFPWSLYALISLVYLFKRSMSCGQIYIFLASWITVLFLVFQPAHSKLISYILPLFPALALATGDFIYNAVINKERVRAFFIASLVTASVLLLTAIGLFFAMPKYSGYLSSKVPAYFLICALLFLSASAFYLLFRRKLFAAVLAFVFFMPAIAPALFSLAVDLKAYISSQDACEYLLKNHNVDTPIICSKLFTRGTRYYTDKEIVVVDLPGKNFFSPHPVSFLANDDEVKAYLRKRPYAYCILKRANLDDFERIELDGFKLTVFKKIGNEYVLRIDTIK